jgi:periplasmic protein TonB
MQEALPPLEADQPIKLNKYLALGIAASVILHVICTVILLGLPQGSPPHQSVTYIDLGAPQQAAPAPPAAPVVPPKAEPAPEPVAAKPEMPLPEQKPAAEPPPQVEQPKAVPEQPPTAKETKVEEQLSHTTLGLGLTRGYFQSLGNGETLRSDVKDYYVAMLQGINEKWWLDQEIQKHRIDPILVNLTVARDGSIVDCQLVSSSGNRHYDRAVLTALRAAGPLPALPANYEGDFFIAPIRLVPPLNLMAW